MSPALVLAALSRERWEIESVFDAFKAHIRSASTMLRSPASALVAQELRGLSLARFAIRKLMEQAVWRQDLGPDRLSFTHAIRVIKRKML